MSDVVYGITRFLHGADGYGFDEVLLFLALNIIQQVIDGLGYIRLGSAGAQLIAKTSDELRQVIQLFGIRKVEDTVREYFWLFALGHASYLFGYGAVGEQHELLYQLVGVFGFFEIYADGFAFFINFELHFIAVEVNGAGGEPFFA